MEPVERLAKALPRTASSEAVMHINVGLAHDLLGALPQGPLYNDLAQHTPRLTNPTELIMISTVLAKAIILELGGEIPDA